MMRTVSGLDREIETFEFEEEIILTPQPCQRDDEGVAHIRRWNIILRRGEQQRAHIGGLSLRWILHCYVGDQGLKEVSKKLSRMLELVKSWGQCGRYHIISF